MEDIAHKRINLKFSEISSYWKSIDINYLNYKSIPEERDALILIVKSIGWVQYQKLMKDLPDMMNHQYCPKIRRPTELKEKLVKVLLYFNTTWKQMNLTPEDIYGPYKQY